MSWDSRSDGSVEFALEESGVESSPLAEFAIDFDDWHALSEFLDKVRIGIDIKDVECEAISGLEELNRNNGIVAKMTPFPRVNDDAKVGSGPRTPQPGEDSPHVRYSSAFFAFAILLS